MIEVRFNPESRYERIWQGSQKSSNLSAGQQLFYYWNILRI